MINGTDHLNSREGDDVPSAQLDSTQSVESEALDKVLAEANIDGSNQAQISPQTRRRIVFAAAAFALLIENLKGSLPTSKEQ